MRGAAGRKPSIHIYFRNDVSHAGEVGLFVQRLHGLFAGFQPEAIGSCCIMSSKDVVKVHLSVQSEHGRYEASASSENLDDLVERLRHDIEEKKIFEKMRISVSN